jgi:RNA polymerase sigma factor (sigma-70 family)
MTAAARPSSPGHGAYAMHAFAATATDFPRCIRTPRCASGFTPQAATLNLHAMNDVAEVSDESLMLAYAAGDVAAFERLYQRHRSKLYRFLARQLHGNGALADEFFQDVWQRVITARESWKPEAAFSTWLYRIAHNRLADHWRALQHRPPAPHDADERTERVPDEDTPERQLSEFEERRRLQMALDELPDEQREVILLRLEQELSLEEIGEMTGVGRETVKSRLRYAMDKLRQRLNQ